MSMNGARSAPDKRTERCTQIPCAKTDKVIKANIRTDINAIAALVRMRNPDAFACTKGRRRAGDGTDDAGECHRAALRPSPAKQPGNPRPGATTRRKRP